MTAHRAVEGFKLVRNSVHVPDWQALRLFNQYRLLLLIAIGAVYYLADDQRTL